MARLSNWIRQAIDGVVDPEKSQRVATLVQQIELEIAQKKKGFVLRDALGGVEYKPRDLEDAKERVFRSMLERGWMDGTLTKNEQAIARWAAQQLELSPARATEINTEFAKRHFACALAAAMEDGVLDRAEESRLNEIASAVGMTLQAFARNFFARESEEFLRGLFAAYVAKNQLAQDEWNRLIETTRRLGLSHDEFLCAVEPQAMRFVEHVLADAKADERLSPNEHATLNWLLENLRLPRGFQAYVAAEVSRLRLLTEIAEGRLPSLPPPAGVAVRAGELIHLHSTAIWRQTRMTKNGPRSDDHQGTLTLTDNRLIFSSPTRTETWSLRKVVTHRGGADWFDVQIQGQAASVFFFPHRNELNYLVFSSAVAMANQTLVRKNESLPTRHIPRVVRQRIWQRYGGKCAECSADDYLEFDHIVPFAKGGSNSDNNVQLLCRRCNSKKSDHI